MKLPYREGSIFAVPLRNGGYAVGVVARITDKKHYGGGALLGYFFGPKTETLPSGKQIDELTANKALKVVMFGDLSLIDGEWPIIGEIENWKRADWPLPDFVRKDELSKKAWRVRYSDDNLVHPLSEEPESYDSSFESDGLCGAGFVELMLTELFE